MALPTWTNRRTTSRHGIAYPFLEREGDIELTLIIDLQHLSGSLAGQSQRIALAGGQKIRLGRNPSNDVKFNDEVDDSVSGVHAKLHYDDDRLYVEDQRSTNGTLLNGSPCPAFQRIAVPDGSRLRLGKQGPEMQVTLRQKGVAPAPAGAAPATADGKAPSTQAAKAGVGRETLLREIGRAQEEQRDEMTRNLAESRTSNRSWMLVAAAVLVLVIAGVAYAIYALNSNRVAEATDTLTKKLEDSRQPWAGVEGSVSPAVAHLRCRYLLRLPRTAGQNDVRLERVAGGEVVGSAVLIRPDVLLTARHVVQPWKSAFAETWDKVSEATGLTTEYDLLQVQFPGQQPITATVLAVAETHDLALLSIADRSLEPVPLAESNKAVQVTDEVAIISYPSHMGKSTLFEPDYSQFGNRRLVEVSDMHPTFLRGTVTLPAAETGDRAGLYFLDASVEPGSSGGAVVNRNGELVGVISQRLERAQQVQVFGQTFHVMEEIGGSVQAVNPDDIRDFLQRAGVL